MQGEDFEVNLRLLRLGGYDMVLGVDWIREISPICFDFNKIEVTFEKGGKRMTITGNAEISTCKLISGKRLHKLFKSKWTQVAQLFLIRTIDQEEEEVDYGGKLVLDSTRDGSIPWEVNQLDLLDELLAKFKDLFEPKALPPPRPLDHTINLKPNSEPINIHSYRYPPK